MASDSLLIPELLDSFELHLRAKNRAAKTIKSYREAVEQLTDHVGQKPADQVTKADMVSGRCPREKRAGDSPAEVRVSRPILEVGHG